MLGRAMHAARPRLAAARAAPRVPLDARLRHGPAPALPFGAQPQQPQQPPPIADVRMAPCRASSSGSDSDGDGPARNTRLQQRLREDGQHARRGFERLRVRGDGACMFRSVAQGDALLRSGRLLPEQHEWEAAQQLRADVVKQLHASRRCARACLGSARWPSGACAALVRMHARAAGAGWVAPCRQAQGPARMDTGQRSGRSGRAPL